MSDCIFCRIVAGQLPATEVARSELAVAFHDLHPQAPVHVLVVPVQHLPNVAAGDSADGERVLGSVLRFAVQVARRLNLLEDGFRLVLNNGRHGGQTVDHLHVHLLGGRPMTWPPG